MPSKKSPRKSTKNKRQTRKSPKILLNKKSRRKNTSSTKHSKSQSINRKRKNNRKHPKYQTINQLGGYMENDNTGALVIEPTTSSDGDLGIQDTIPGFPKMNVCTIL